MFSFSVFGQEADVSVEELDVEEPGIISWFKNAADTVRIWAARDPVKKAELELRKASRQIIRTRKMVREGADDAGLKAKLEMINGKYEELIGQINNRVEQYKEANPEANDRLNSFLDKYTNHQLKHQEILQKLEEQVPQEVMAKIQENRQAHLEKFSEVMTRLQDKEEFKERLKSVLESGKNAVRKVQLMEVIEELGQQDVLEVRERVREMKQENKKLFDLDVEDDEDDQEDEDEEDEDENNKEGKGKKDNDLGELIPN